MELGNRNSDRGTMSQINVTPLVDVMLVLLVIFMVTAPMMQQGVQVNLPKADTKALKSPEEAVVVSIEKSGRGFIDKTDIPPDLFPRAFVIEIWIQIFEEVFALS